MAKKDERNLNITIKNQEEEKENLLISISDVLKNMKRYLAVTYSFIKPTLSEPLK